MAEEKTFSAKQIATRIGTEAKILRKFFRDEKSGYSAVGQGGRYDFPESDLPKIKAAFDAWNQGKVRRQRPTNAQRALAEKAGIVPKARKEAPAAPRAPRRKRSIAAANPLDQDDLLTRCRSSIAERAAAHGVTVKSGQWTPIKEAPKKLLSPAEARRIVPGLSPKDFDPEASAEAAAQLEDLTEEESIRLFDEALEGLTEDE